MKEQIRFNQAVLEACPTGLLVFDENRAIRWLNPAFEEMLDLSGETLIGKDQASLPAELHALFDDSDILHLTDDNDEDRWLQRLVRDVVDGDDTPLQIHFYQDISERVNSQQQCEQLRQQVQELSITDDLTGLANPRAIIQALANQATRSRRYGNPFTLAVIQISNQAAPGTDLPDTTTLIFSQYLRDRLRWADAIGRYEKDLFLILMPETNLDDAVKLLQQVRQECQEGALKDLGNDPLPALSLGAAAWEKGDDPTRLLRRARENLD
jgi:diguanylate cyclase (GGDEF)-like protein